MSQSSYEEVEEIANLLLEKTPIRPQLGIICGTGLGGLADTLQDRFVVDYKDIPGFPVSTVTGHAGRFVFGKICDREVICMQGRFHLYEGYDMSKITMPVRVMKLMGVKTLIVTNAAGGLNPEFQVGDLMIIKDHIFMPNFAGHNPLVGVNEERFGARFVAMSQVYSQELRTHAKKIASQLNMDSYVKEGVYVMLGGPSFETIAECRMLRAIGADVVGMSTCPEVVVAAHCGMTVFALSMVTNQCVMEYDDEREANHEEVLEAGDNRSQDLQKFITQLIKSMPDHNFNVLPNGV